MVHRFFYLLLASMLLSFGTIEDAQVIYIKSHLPLAIKEQKRSGIPVSIKLAQAFIESNGGKSVLASRANNHFGIKCKSYWTGPRYFYTDDDKDTDGNLIPSCFRMYESAEDSFEDHSDFLMNSERYHELFTYDKSDYKKWANGLLKCGYATDSKYAIKIIEVIEKYSLDQYDTENISMK
jgi:flagellum-specific peptidoglycan hydrolase FlgJ